MCQFAANINRWTLCRRTKVELLNKTGSCLDALEHSAIKRCGYCKLANTSNSYNILHKIIYVRSQIETRIALAETRRERTRSRVLIAADQRARTATRTANAVCPMAAETAAEARGPRWPERRPPESGS